MNFVEIYLIFQMATDSVFALMRTCVTTRRYQNKTISEKSFLQKYTTTDIMGCAFKCCTNSKCQTFTYSDMDCRCYPKTINLYTDSLVPNANAELYSRSSWKDVHQRKTGYGQRKTQLNGKRGHGESCKEAKECSVPGSICDKDTFMKCLCPVGLYYSQSQNVCLKRCGKFAEKLDKYQSYGITEHNEKRILVTRRIGCFQQCLRVTKFTCITVEWISSVCFLAKVGFFDVPEKDRLTNVTGYNFFGQRQCQ